MICDPWRDPDEECAKESKRHLPSAVLKYRKMFVDVHVKDNPLIKTAPTTKHFFLLEKSEKRIHFMCRNRTANVPYSDCYSVQEEWIIERPE